VQKVGVQDFRTGSNESLCLSLLIEDTVIQDEKFNFIETELYAFHNLQSLEIVRSQLDTFKPKRLSRFLEILSLEGNCLTALSQLRF
jgi:hypothetical protein